MDPILVNKIAVWRDLFLFLIILIVLLIEHDFFFILRDASSFLLMIFIKDVLNDFEIYKG